MTGQPSTVAVMGAGALGCYYGARLMQAGHTVYFIARGATLAALRERGLRVERDTETVELPVVPATDRCDDIGPVDLLLIATKGHHLTEAVPACQPLVAAHSVVLPLLNGMDISERVAARLGQGTVLGATTYLPVKRVAPGVVHQAGDEKRIALGALEPAHEAAATHTLELLRQADINAELSPDIRSEVWIKAIGFGAFAGAQCASRLPVGAMLQDAETRGLFDGLVREGMQLAAATGVSVPPDLVERLRAVLASYPPQHTVSLYDDLVAGLPLELETTVGAMVSLGRRLGIPAPMTQRAYDAIRPYANGTRSPGGQAPSSQPGRP